MNVISSLAKPTLDVAPQPPEHTSAQAPLAPLPRVSKTLRLFARLSKAARIAILSITRSVPVAAQMAENASLVEAAQPLSVHVARFQSLERGAAHSS